MGTLLDTASGARLLLRAEHVIGRDPARCDTCLTDPEVSAIHAVVRFRDNRWCIADYGRNGTFVEGKALTRAVWTPLQLGQRLRFGAPELALWKMQDTSPPVTSLVPLEPQLPPIPLGCNTLLPSPQAPEITIYQGAGGCWILEVEDGSHELSDGDTVAFGGRTYTLAISRYVDDTVSCRASHGASLSFLVSRDEERVCLWIKQGMTTLDLGERSHHYCLLTLARQRVSDARSGLAPDVQGWMSTADLARQLGIDPQHLNIQIFRARNQLMSSATDGPAVAEIVERRRGFLRLGTFAFDIVRAGALEADYVPGRYRGTEHVNLRA